MFQYKFSVIMPLYNVENFFAEAVESVITQTIGFRENIQIVLVNDGSPDRVEDLCLRYKEDYPENIIYVSKENGLQHQGFSGRAWYLQLMREERSRSGMRMWKALILKKEAMRKK